jgi:glycosyltransferase involved in cell wall biosynthesis
LAAYEKRVRSAIGQAGLHGFVYLTGRVTPPQLKAYYLIAHAFLCASHHEGFCVPLAEAMGFQIPCVAWARAAVASTLGPEALVWADLDPIVLAQSVHECLENSAVSNYLVERQQARYKRLFSPTAVKERFLRCLRTRLRGVLV